MNENNEVTAADVRACMRGDVYGEAETMTDAWFADHVALNDIDLAVSPRWTVEGELSAFALLAFREDRAWIGGLGVGPRFRGEGMGGVCLADTLRIVREAGATTVELEVLEQNLAAIALYEHGGFEQIGELVAWRRERRSEPRTGADGTISTSARDAAGVAATARRPSTCWQREPRSVAAAAPFVTLTIGDEWNPAAYAFVRPGGPRGDVLLDAGARDDSAAYALIDALDAQFAAHDIRLINEPSRGPLDEALSSNPFWDPVARQRRMRVQLR